MKRLLRLLSSLNSVFTVRLPGLLPAPFDSGTLVSLTSLISKSLTVPNVSVRKHRNDKVTDQG